MNKLRDRVAARLKQRAEEEMAGKQLELDLFSEDDSGQNKDETDNSNDTADTVSTKKSTKKRSSEKTKKKKPGSSSKASSSTKTAKKKSRKRATSEKDTDSDDADNASKAKAAGKKSGKKRQKAKSTKTAAETEESKTEASTAHDDTETPAQESTDTDKEEVQAGGGDDDTPPPGDDNSGGPGGGDDDTPPPGDDGDGSGDEEEPSSLRRMMSNYFIEYASYVIRERAIPHLDDGLKPVHRRILHSLHEMDDGKLHKVANVVGNTMKYHPHGDASIYNALVHLANKGFFIDRQGNFGNILTGDPASASRYIECRLSELAREVLFNKELTEYMDSYDGRHQEPVVLPAKVPVLLMQGVEGIAVGMSTRIMPHNFVELLKAQIAILRKKDYEIYPDFLQGGLMDVSEYDQGRGRIRLRAKIETPNDKTLIIKEIPATTTTESLIQSIELADNKGKLKLSSINDYTSDEVEIEVKPARGVYAEETKKALYAYTDCEVSISCHCLVIKDNQPEKMTVNRILEHNTRKLQEGLQAELELAIRKIMDRYHFKSLVQIFIENRIYKEIESCESYAAVKEAVRDGLEPFVEALVCPAEAGLAKIQKRDPVVRPISDEDIESLLKIPIRRISLFDINKNKDELNALTEEGEQVLKNLRNLTKYTIRYLKGLIKTYGKEHSRRTEIDELKQVDRREIALQNLKVGLDRKNGFLGTDVKDDNPIECTEYDRLVIFKWDGTFKVVPVPERLYVGPVCEVYKADREQVYSMVYRKKKNRVCYAKRFQVSSYIMDREYEATPKGCKVEKILDRYGVELRCEFRPAPRQRETHCDIVFDDIEMRKATARGFKVHDKDIVKFIQTKRGSNTPNGDDEESDENDDS